MDVTDSLNDAVSTLVTQPTAILPAYFVGQSVGTIARVFPLVGFVVAYLLLVAGGRIAAVEEVLREIDVAALQDDPASIDPETVPIDELEAAIADLFTPGVIAVVIVSLVLGLLAFVLVGAAVSAGQIHTVYAALQDRTALVAGVSGVIRDAGPFVGLRLLRYALYLLVTVVYGLVVFVAATVYAAAEGIGLVVAGAAALLAPVWLLTLIVIAAVFVFAPQAVVIDDRGTIGGLKGGAGFIRRRPGAFAAYVLIAIGIGGTVAGGNAVFAFLGVPQILGVVTILAVTPFLHLFKTGLYAGGERIDIAPLLSGERRPVLERLREGSRRCVAELWAFTKRTPGLTALSLVLFGLGTMAGYYAVAGLAFETPAVGDPTAVFGRVPLGTFVMIAANNWLVAVAQAFAGLAFGVPTAVNLLFNGAIVGLVAGLSADLWLVATLILPHAVVEVPALAVSGALGLHLGAVAWRRYRNRIDDAAVADELRIAFWVLVGLAAVFVVAAGIETFLTPRIAGWLY